MPLNREIATNSYIKTSYTDLKTFATWLIKTNISVSIVIAVHDDIGISIEGGVKDSI